MVIGVKDKLLVIASDEFLDKELLVDFVLGFCLFLAPEKGVNLALLPPLIKVLNGGHVDFASHFVLLGLPLVFDLFVVHNPDKRTILVLDFKGILNGGAPLSRRLHHSYDKPLVPEVLPCLHTVKLIKCWLVKRVLRVQHYKQVTLRAAC